MNKNTDNAWERFEQLAHEYDRRVEEIALQHPLQTEAPQHQHIAFRRFAAAVAAVAAVIGGAIWLTIARPAEGTLGVPASGKFAKASVAEYRELSYIRCNSQCDAQYIADETHQVL